MTAVAIQSPVAAAPPTAAPVALPRPTLKAAPKAKAAKPAPISLKTMVAGTTVRKTIIRAAATSKAPALSMLRAGITVPFVGIYGNWLRVMTPCEMKGWIRAKDMKLIRPATGTGRWSDAVFVIDPGHGGRESGAQGHAKTTEKQMNLGIAIRLANDLKGARVFLTRTGDYSTGLRYRALLASRLRATAFVSMHNNSGPTVPSAIPGTQTWHQSKSIQSTKLAILLYKNLFPTLSKYKARWVSSKKIGPLVRLNKEGTDYYAVLRESAVPSVIVESLFISNPTEEQLLREGAVRQAIADSAAKALRQYVAQGGGKSVKPLNVKMGKSGGLSKACRDPS